MQESLAKVLCEEILEYVLWCDQSEKANKHLIRDSFDLSHQVFGFTQGILFLHHFVDENWEIVGARVLVKILV